MKPTTIILAIIVGAAAATADADMYRCTDYDGRPVFADRKLGNECRAITIEPYPVDDKPETHYGLVVTADTESLEYGY